MDSTPIKEKFALDLRFLSLVRYCDVYRRAENEGDGNKKGSASDIEVRLTLEQLGEVRRMIEKEISIASHVAVLADDANFKEACAILPELEALVVEARKHGQVIR